MAKIIRKIKEEIIHALPAIIYFLIALSVIYFCIGLSLPPGEERYFSYPMILLGALLLGKVIVIVNVLPFVNLFPKKPLIYNITWKFILYAFFVFLAWVGDSFFHLIYQYDQFDLAYYAIKAELLSPVFLATLVWLLLIFLVYVFLSEYMRVLGFKKVIRMLLVNPNPDER